MKSENGESVWLIGFGPMGQAHFEALKSVKKEVKVFTLRGGLREFDNKDIITHPVVDIERFSRPSHVVVAAPIFSQLSIVEMLIGLGVENILVEKPVSLDAKLLAPLEIKASLLGIRIFVALNRRFYESVIKLSEIVASDAITSIKIDGSENIQRLRSIQTDSNILENWSLANTIHLFDLAAYLIKKSEKSFAIESKFFSSDNQSSFNGKPGLVHAVYVSENGAHISYAHNWMVSGKWSFEVCTQTARYVLNPLEELSRFDEYTFQYKPLTADDAKDNCKPGLRGQLSSFLGEQAELCSLDEFIDSVGLFGSLLGDYATVDSPEDLQRSKKRLQILHGESVEDLELDGFYNPEVEVFYVSNAPPEKLIEGMDYLRQAAGERSLVLITDCRSFQDQAIEMRRCENLKFEIAPYVTVDPAVDEWLYEDCHALAAGITDRIRRILRQPLGVGSLHQRTIRVGLLDRLVASIRLLVNLEELMDRVQPELLTCLKMETWREKQVINHFRQFSAGSSANGFEKSNFELLTTLQGSFIIEDMEWVSLSGKPVRANMDFRTRRLVSGIYRDPQYRKTILPIIGACSECGPVDVILLSATADNVVEYFGSAFAALPRRQKARIRFLVPVKKLTKRLGLSAQAQAVVQNVTLDIPDLIFRSGLVRLEKFQTMAQQIIAVSLPRLLIDIDIHSRRLEKAIGACTEAVIVSPGRHLVSSIAVERANALGVPSFELQSGTLSPSPRYVAPIAKHIFCIDSFSKGVYLNLGVKEEQLSVVGSVKLDRDLAPYRLKSESIKVVAASRCLFFAGQPVEYNQLGIWLDWIAMVLELDQSLTCVLRPHPNEGDHRVELYLSMISRVGSERVKIERDKKIGEILITTDVCITHYSTVGLEAFALGKPVISLRVADKPPPFDLVELGVAFSASDFKSFKNLIDEALDVENANSRFSLSMDAEKQLRDGNALSRVFGGIEQSHQNFLQRLKTGLRFNARKFRSLNILRRARVAVERVK